ncbi:ATP-binding cassette subfamily B protein [Nitrospina gracilis]|uniref:ABC transporter ATP-binding protein n=2 Tax=Nitrospina TaxID=35800 RepID=UPI001F461F18|nr:ABC transporter ATP-binding protein [Nitrospina sp. Nb-3]MCF8723989.1 ATP-binding cassette subfamily B protein [Nitrospina sp. Nb-3]
MNEWEETLDDRYYDWPLFTRILGYLRPYRMLVLVSVGLLLSVSLLNLAGPYLTKIAIDEHIRVDDYSGLDQIALIYLVVLVGAFVCQFFQYYTIQFIGQQVMYDLRTQVFGHLHKMSFRFFDRNPIGKMITRTVNDIEVLNEMLTSGLILVFSDLFTLVGIFFMLAYLDWRLMLVVCVVFPFLYLATNAYRTRARDALRKNRAHQTTLNTLLEENLSGMNTVQMFNQEENRRKQFTDVSGSKLREDLRSLFYNSVYLPSIDVFSAIGMGLVIWYGGGRFVQDEVELGVLVAFLQYLHKFFEPIRDLAEKFNIIQTAMASSERIFELLDTEEDLPNPAQPKPLKKIEGRVEFENVWFAYKNENYVLQDVSFSLEPGESLAIVGATGSGKTTIVNTLYRFYDIQKGRIRVDGTSLSEVDKYALRSQMALVQQDVFLFARNVMDNIRLGNTELGVEEIESIAHAVHSHHFIDNLPHKYEQTLMEGGNSLSLGQKQLLSFARALASNPRILILDEATSNVDTETEKKIQDAIQNLIQGRTSIVIAHRLSTLQHVDKVLVLRHGRVVEFGTRRELIQQKGTYYNLLKLQSDLTKST